MNFKQTIMCIGLLGFFMQSVASDTVRDVPECYKNIFFAAEDAAKLAWGITIDELASIAAKMWGYGKEHYIASGLSAALIAYLLYNYQPRVTFDRPIFGGFRQRLGGWFAPGASVVTTTRVPLPQPRTVVVSQPSCSQQQRCRAYEDPDDESYYNDPYAVAEPYSSTRYRHQ